MENEKTMTEQESLAVIKEMIERSRTNFKEQSFYYLMWGWLVVGAVLVEALLFNQGLSYHYIVWPIMGFAGGITSGIYGRMQGKKAGRSTHIDRAMGYVWIGFIMYLFIVLLLSATGKFGNATEGWNTSFLLIMGLYGLGTFISGGILKFKPLVIGGIASFVLVALTVFIPSLVATFNGALLMLAASIIVSYLIPGYMLKRS
jgi:hypothetical protein